MSETYNVCDYAVAFIDLLGQKSAMPSRHLHDLTEEAIQEIKDSVGRIIGTQELFINFYEGHTGGNTLFNSFPKKVQDSLPDMAPGKLKWQPFSDGMMVYIPLGKGIIASPTNSLFSLLCASGMLCIYGLAARSPLRIGIDVAWALEYRPGELYGSAIAHAYELESKVAKWPRVVVGEGLLGYLSWYVDSDDGSLTARYRSAMAKTCLSFLARDRNEQVFLDYAGPEFYHITKGSQIDTIYQSALTFASSELSHWKKQGNNKLTNRYEMLVSYLRSREITAKS